MTGEQTLGSPALYAEADATTAGGTVLMGFSRWHSLYELKPITAAPALVQPGVSRSDGGNSFQTGLSLPASLSCWASPKEAILIVSLTF